MRLKQDISSLTLVPMGGGVFEVTVNGKKFIPKNKPANSPIPSPSLKPSAPG